MDKKKLRETQGSSWSRQVFDSKSGNPETTPMQTLWNQKNATEKFLAAKCL